MWWTVTALATTVLTGGLIAYAGDLIGRRMGKRRASLFGLRPRHTAAIITAATGTLISLLTTLAIYVAVEPVRRVILQGESAIRANAGLRKENDRLISARTRERHALRRARQERASAETQRLRAVAARVTADKRLKVVQVSLRVALAQARSTEMARRLAETGAKRARAEADSERSAAQDLARRNERLRSVTSELTDRSSELQQRNEQLRQANTALGATNAAYSQENDAISQQNEKLVRDRDQLTSLLERLRAQQVQLANETESLQAKYKEMQDSYTTAYGAHRSLWAMFEALRTRRIAVHGGEDLARTVIPSGTPPEGVRKAIDSLLSAAHIAALARGAAPGERARAVEIVDKRFTTPTASGSTVLRVTEDDRIDAIVNRVSRSDEPICLLAVAVANSAQGEPAAIDLQPLSNPLVYRKGQEVAVRKIDGSNSPNEVFDELVLMLKGLGQTALSRGIIPRMDPATGEPQVGSYSAADLVNLSTKVRAMRRLVEITAYAANDTTASDRLDLTFRLRPAI